MGGITAAAADGPVLTLLDDLSSKVWPRTHRLLDIILVLFVLEKLV